MVSTLQGEIIQQTHIDLGIHFLFLGRFIHSPLVCASYKTRTHHPPPLGKESEI